MFVLCEWGVRVDNETYSVRLAKLIFVNLFYYSAYFCYYLWVLLHFLVLIMSFTILFSQLLHLSIVFSVKSFQFQLN